jgi:hypothetical protein
MYRKLDPERIVATVQRLRDRIHERFPESSLGRVANEFLQVTGQAVWRAEWLSRPNYWLRISVGALTVALLVIILGIIRALKISPQVDRVTELFQAVDAALNTLILLSGAIYFLVSLEKRLKRRHALAQIHELRSLAHVVDMHQLTKDPEVLIASGRQTSSSPTRTLTQFELSRYLGYCSEMLALMGKVAALQVQHYDDPVVLSAVDQIEDLTSALSNKVWQKIMILDQSLEAASRGTAPAEIQRLLSDQPPPPP